MNENLFDEIDRFLANGGESASHDRSGFDENYCYDAEPPDDGNEWLRVETMEGQVFWVKIGQKV